jgi:hypothetical protein
MWFNGQQFRAGVGITTMHPTFDCETYSEAGFSFGHHVPGKWGPLPWLSPKAQKKSRGLSAVGAYNYVTHPTFRVLCMYYDLLDGKGRRKWVPVMTEFGLADEPHDLIAYAKAGGILEAFNMGFEFYVWNLYLAVKYGWPLLKLEQMRCTMAKARVSAYPGSLGELGYVLGLVNKKDPMGQWLIDTLTVPKNPGEKMKKLPDPEPQYNHTVPRQMSMDKLMEPRHPDGCPCPECDIPF